MTVAKAEVYGSPTDPARQSVSGANLVQTLYRITNITTTAVGTNTVDVGYLPEGAVPIGGYFATEDLDTGTEVLDIDVGITDNGVDGADPDFFANGGVYTGDNAITDFPFTNASNVRLFTGPFPKTQLAKKTLVQVVFNVAANAGGTGKIVTRVDYICPGKATS